MAPWVAELVVFPAFIDSQQGEVITFWLKEFGFLLVSLSLLLSWPVEDVLQQAMEREDACETALACGFATNATGL